MTERRLGKEAAEPVKETADLENIVPAPIDRLGDAGSWCRERLLACSLYGTPLLVAVQRYRTPTCTAFMKAAGILGEEEFYTVIICFLIWVVEVRLALLFGALMCMGFIVANFLKNFLRLPRPASPPVKPLVRLNDWGFPSHHSLNGVALPWYLYFYVCEHWQLTALQQTVSFFAVCIWSSLVMFDRLYLGVHSPADVLTGGFLGCALLAVFMQFDAVVESILTTKEMLWSLPVWAILLTLAHPDSGRPTITRLETVSLLGIVVGFAIAENRIKQRYPVMLSLLEMPMETDVSMHKIVAMAVARVVLGMILLESARQIMKMIFRPLVFYTMKAIFGDKVYACSKLPKSTVSFYNKKNYRLPGSEKAFDEESSSDLLISENEKSHRYSNTFTDDHIDADIPVKLIVYILTGWVGMEGIPYAFQLLRLTL